MHHYDDHKQPKSRNGQSHGLVDHKHGCPHCDKIQAPCLPHKGPFQSFQMSGRRVVGIVNAAVIPKYKKAGTLAHENHTVDVKLGREEQSVGVLQFDHDTRLFDEVAMAEEVRPYHGQPERSEQVHKKSNRVCCV